MYTKQRRDKVKIRQHQNKTLLKRLYLSYKLGFFITHFIEIYKKVPKIELTLSCPESPPLMISGAMYSIVPQNEYALSALNKQSNKKEFDFKLV